MQRPTPGLELNVAPTMQVRALSMYRLLHASPNPPVAAAGALLTADSNCGSMQVSAINFIDEAVLNLPTREFAQYLKSVDAQVCDPSVENTTNVCKDSGCGSDREQLLG